MFLFENKMNGDKGIEVDVRMSCIPSRLVEHEMVFVKRVQCCARIYIKVFFFALISGVERL